jgi:hypothetical protein
MLPGFNKIIEERIRAAQRKGEFENLNGAGKPLNLDEMNGVPEELRLAYKLLKNADLLPPEIELKKEIHQTEDLLQNVTDVADRYRLLKKLNFLIMKLNTVRSGAIEFEAPQQYMDKIASRVASSRSGSDHSGDRAKTG